MPEVEFRALIPIPNSEITVVQLKVSVGNRLLIQTYSTASVQNVSINYRHRNFSYGIEGIAQDLVIEVILDDSIANSISSDSLFPETSQGDLTQDVSEPSSQ